MTTHPPLGTTPVSAGDLNRSTAQVLDRVEAGEQLAITRHGIVVALLRPARPHPLAALVRAGLVEPAVQLSFPSQPR
ncbi:hypothetical protein GCM10027047_28710 [Rhodococcus aerolatus]